jgi:hypothetical protein
MMKNDFVLDFKDQNGKRYVFSRENFDKHKDKHPELSTKDFLQNCIKKTICESELIYPAYREKNRFCFYYYEYQIGDRKWYTKVVVEKTRWLSIIITAFRLDKVHEKKYFIETLCKRP